MKIVTKLDPHTVLTAFSTEKVHAIITKEAGVTVVDLSATPKVSVPWALNLITTAQDEKLRTDIRNLKIKNKALTSQLASKEAEQPSILGGLSIICEHKHPLNYTKDEILSAWKADPDLMQWKEDKFEQLYKDECKRTDSLAQQLGDAKEGMTTVRQQRNKFDTSVDNMIIKYDNLKKATTIKIGTMSDEVARLQRLVDNLKVDNDDFETANRQYGNTITTLRKRVVELQNEDYETKLAELNSNNIRMFDDITNYKVTVTKQAGLITGFTKQLKSISKDKDILEKANWNMKKQLASKLTDLKKLVVAETIEELQQKL